MTRSPILRNGAMAILNLLRSVSELIWAILFVAAVGLGPFPGALALGVNYGGILGRLYAEAIENVDTGPIEAIEATRPAGCRSSPSRCCRRRCRSS